MLYDDYRVFPKLKENLCGRQISVISHDIEVMPAVNEWFEEVGEISPVMLLKSWSISGTSALGCRKIK